MEDEVKGRPHQTTGREVNFLIHNNKLIDQETYLTRSGTLLRVERSRHNHFSSQRMNLTALHPKLHLRSLAPQKNMGMARRSTKAVMAAISPSATASPAPAIQELVVAERPKPMMAG